MMRQHQSLPAFDRKFVVVLVLIAILQNVVAEAVSLPSIFGAQGAQSPVPQNTAKYILDLEGKYLHYYGDRQIFLLALSPALRQHLKASSESERPITYEVDLLAAGESDWSKVPGWASPNHGGADAKHVFYGREIRNAPKTSYGNAIHLSLGPKEDPEGWTTEEMTENYNFWRAIEHDHQSVGQADQVRQFRQNIADELGGTFLARWGSGVTTKAHRFVFQMYTADSQSEAKNPGSHFFEKFPQGSPPTTQVVFVEAEDGCKGTPTPGGTEQPSQLLL